MTLQNPTLALVLLLILAAIVLLQSALIIVAVLKVGKRLGTLHEKTARLSEKASSTLAAAERVLNSADSIRERIPVWEGNLSRTVESLARSTRAADRKAEETVAYLRRKAEAANRRSDSVLTGFSKTTFRVHRAIANPAHRVSAAVSALQAGIARFIFRGDKGNGRQPDQQIFI